MFFLKRILVKCYFNIYTFLKIYFVIFFVRYLYTFCRILNFSRWLKKNRESIEIGQTDFTKAEIEQIIILLGREYRGIDYHLMNKNCNNFSSKFCKVNSNLCLLN